MLRVIKVPRLGAYGLAVAGLEDHKDLLVPAAEHWPQVRVSWLPGGPSRPPSSISEARAVYPFDGGGHAVVDRVHGTATFVTPKRPTTDELLHPRLAMVGAVCAGWLGSDAFHAGAFAHRGRAWGVVGDGKEGKSTLLATLHVMGVDIVADDTLIIRDGLCLSGARCIDLRDDVPERLGLSDCVVSVRGGQRRRLSLGPPPPAVALGGWVFLRWAEDVVLEPISTAARLERIGRLRGWHRRGATGPTRLLELASLPAWELRRPRDLELMPEVVRLLEGVLGSSG
jgi:hypothetical protein